jgi:PleD family two-component response regulator
MAAYMVAHYRDLPAVQLKIKDSSDEIFRRAKADGVTGLPAADTIKEELSKAMDLLERVDFQFKK